MEVDGIAMWSPLGPFLADIFMTELEKAILLELTECMKCWKRYANDTICLLN